MKKNGFTFIEALVGIALLAIIVTSIFTGFQMIFKVLAQSQNKIVAVDLAKEQIEVIRNMSYEDIGTQDGIPTGQIPQTRTKQVGGTIFTVDTDIIFIDDSFDGIAPEDTLPADYKKARIKVSWRRGGQTKSITEITNISPAGLESEVGGGVLSIYVNDSQSGEVIPNAWVEITNYDVSPGIYIFTTADDNGWLSRPGLIASDGYQIEISKTGYDEHNTYSESASFDPDPEYSHAQVIEGEKTIRYFVISQASTINIETIDIHDNPIGNISFTLEGGREIGVNPLTEKAVYSYKNSLSTNASGLRQLANMSGGEYYLDITNPNYVVLAPNLNNSILVEAGVSQTISITLVSIDEPCLRLRVEDSSTGQAISTAAARLYGEEYDKTSPTNEDGIAVFPFDETDLANGSYTLSVTKTGYSEYSSSQSVNDFTETTIQLNSW